MLLHYQFKNYSDFPNCNTDNNSLVMILQSAALMSVGLLYEGSAHPQTMQILLVYCFSSLLVDWLNVPFIVLFCLCG